MNTTAHSLSSLPFVQTNEDGSIESLWKVRPTGDYDTDFATGKSYAQALIVRIRANQTGGGLYQICKAMPRKQFSTIEIGFYTEIGLAVAGL